MRPGYLQHARRHLPGGSDPLLLDITQLPIPSAVFEYLAIEPIGDGIPVPSGNTNFTPIMFDALRTNRTDLFSLQDFGSGEPYAASLGTGYFAWETRIGFQPYPHILASSGDASGTLAPATPETGVSFATDDGGIGGWGLIFDNSDVYVAYLSASGYMNVASAAPWYLGFELNNVVNSDAMITHVSMRFSRLSGHLPDESSNIFVHS